MRRGEVWWANLHRPWGRRPVLLLARDNAYEILSGVIVAPLTSTIRGAPSLVPLDPRADGVPRACVINLDAMLTVSSDWLDELIVRLRPEKMREVEEAIHFALALSY